MKNGDRPLLGIFGGTFNPVHLGHMRLVVEVMESVRPARLDLLPSARPPHKGGRRLLPFDLRVELLEAAIAGMAGVFVNTLENERDTPSYTVDTLRLYREREPGSRLFFILGAEDFPLITTWRQWETLPSLADIVVVPRSGAAGEVFSDTVRGLWPEAAPLAPPFGAADAAYAMPDVAEAGRFIHLPLPRLDIRAELIRERLLAGRSAKFLVPDAVHALLKNRPEAVAVWRA
jgi:nicotinate-nucleotide adenylyltransferase